MRRFMTLAELIDFLKAKPAESGAPPPSETAGSLRTFQSSSKPAGSGEQHAAQKLLYGFPRRRRPVVRARA